MPWQIERARLTCFFAGPVELDNLSWWGDVIGTPPDESVFRRSEGIRVDRGIVNGRDFVLQAQGPKADWIVKPVDQLREEIFSFVGSYEDASTELKGVLQDWLVATESISRIAVGIVALAPVDSIERGFELLQRYLPAVNLEGGATADFLFQINRPAIIEIPGEQLSINRLAKWSVIQATLANQLFSQEGPIGPSRVVAAGNAVRCELDLNTDSGHRAKYDGAVKTQIIDFLLAQGTAILRDGDPVGRE